MTRSHFLSFFQDLNIGIALWLAAGGDGWLYEETSSNDGIQSQRVKYKSMARILLVGSGADEQCAGYGRHKTKFRNKRWSLICVEHSFPRLCCNLNVSK